MTIPYYFHVHSDPIRFFPSIIDFGTVAKNFEQIKVNIKLRAVKDNNNYYVQDILVPTDEERLDFLMTDSRKLNLEKKPLKKTDETPLGVTILNPSKSGLIESQIVFIVQ